MLKKLRITLATIFFVGITLMFLDFTGTLHHWLGWMAKVQFLPAVLALNVVIILVLLVLTLVFGRIYCSVICPLGIFQDLVARLRRKKNKYSYSKAISWLRYTMLGIMVVAIVAGIGSVVQLLAPYSAYGRIATMIFQPIWKFGNNLLASVAERIDSYAFYRTEVLVPAMGVVLIVAVATALLVGILAWRNGRTYCNTICPVGTVLSFFARFSWFKIRFDEDKCRNCSLCTKNCKAACIDFKTHTVDYSRCVVCGNCIDKCKFGALSYVGGYKSTKASVNNDNNSDSAGKAANTDSTVDAGKRSFLLSAALATTAAMAQDKKKVDGGLAVIEDKVTPERQTPITPPGSVSARNMAQHCTACQLCVSECPNQVLRPSNSLSSFMQPVMSYELGYCRPECTRCADVCPTGAIHHIAKEQKSSTQIGHAVWIKKNCIPLTDGVECGNCARHCPVGAIEMVPSNPDDEESAYVPAVNESRCIGCGACENLCPARPFSAIYVEGHEVHKEV